VELAHSPLARARKVDRVSDYAQGWLRKREAQGVKDRTGARRSKGRTVALSLVVGLQESAIAASEPTDSPPASSPYRARIGRHAVGSTISPRKRIVLVGTSRMTKKKGWSTVTVAFGRIAAASSKPTAVAAAATVPSSSTSTNA